ncbi:MAG: hypothetical protein D6797_03885 [Bdellovibrio sp.]|nr:MAG: hypothetical protein D6797_03885 [Bdellovibrio sp.]
MSITAFPLMMIAFLASFSSFAGSTLQDPYFQLIAKPDQVCLQWRELKNHDQEKQLQRLLEQEHLDVLLGLSPFCSPRLPDLFAQKIDMIEVLNQFAEMEKQDPQWKTRQQALEPILYDVAVLDDSQKQFILKNFKSLTVEDLNIFGVAKFPTEEPFSQYYYWATVKWENVQGKGGAFFILGTFKDLSSKFTGLLNQKGQEAFLRYFKKYAVSQNQMFLQSFDAEEEPPEALLNLVHQVIGMELGLVSDMRVSLSLLDSLQKALEGLGEPEETEPQQPFFQFYHPIYILPGEGGPLVLRSVKM